MHINGPKRIQHNLVIHELSLNIGMYWFFSFVVMFKYSKWMILHIENRIWLSFIKIRANSKIWKRWKSTLYFIQKKKKWFAIEKSIFQCLVVPFNSLSHFLHLKFLTVVNRFFSIHLYVHFRKDFGLLFKPRKSWAQHMHTYTLRHNHVKWGKASFLTAWKRDDDDTHIFTSRFLQLFSWHKSF